MKKKNMNITVAIETCAVFILAQLGGKVSKLIDFAAFPLVISTLAVLAILIHVKIIRSHESDPSTQDSQRDEPSALKENKRISMVSVFPVGMFVGLLGGTLLPFIFPTPITLSAEYSSTLATSNIYYYEISGIIGGLAISLLCAILLDAYLGASFSVGYGFGLPSAILFTRPLENELFGTYSLSLIIFGIMTFLLIINKTRLSHLKKIITEKRY